jgi:hypothetical protein
MRRPQLTLRRLMVVVAVAALACGLEMGRRRREGFLALEGMHARKMDQYRQMSDQFAYNAKSHRGQAEKIRAGFFLYWPKAVVVDGLAGLVEADAKAYRAIADHHERMRDKYLKAARFPFGPVEPDPPSPADPSDEAW